MEIPVKTGIPADSCGSGPGRRHVNRFFAAFSSSSEERLPDMYRKFATTLAVGLALAAVAVAPASAASHLTITPSHLKFGTVYATTPTTKTVTLINTGTAAITLNSFTFNNPDFSENDTCGGMIAAGGNCQVAVTITTGTLGAIAGAKMTITDSAAASPQKLPLTAKVVALPACAATTSGSFTYTNHMLATWRTNHTATTLKNGTCCWSAVLQRPSVPSHPAPRFSISRPAPTRCRPSIPRMAA